MPWTVFPEALKTRPSGCGAMFTTKHPWAVPALNRLHDISVWRQFSTIWSKIVYRALDLVEHEYRWPPTMMDGLFVVWLQGYLKHAKALVLEDDFVVLRSRYHCIKCWIPSRWIQIRTVVGHVTLANSVQRI
jgi:hypothetical protein